MSSFLFGFAAALLLSIGSRDQLLVARAAEVLGASILLAGCVAAIFTAGLMALGGDLVASLLPPAAKQMLVAFAMLLASVELFWPNRERAPKEPTRSVFAAFVVLLMRQWGDAARFMLFALAAATALPGHVGAGGMVGSAAALAIGWALGSDLERFPLRQTRIGMGILVLLIGIGLALDARGIL